MFMCILPKETHTESESEIRLEMLANAPFVMQRESCDVDTRRIMEKLNLEVRTICHVVDDKTTVEMVKSGFGFAIMPRLTMYGLEQEVKMLKIFPDSILTSSSEELCPVSLSLNIKTPS